MLKNKLKEKFTEIYESWGKLRIDTNKKSNKKVNTIKNNKEKDATDVFLNMR